MRRDADPDRVLHGLLDRLERQSERTRRITARPTQAFSSVAERDVLVAGFSAAVDAGAVLVEYDRDAPHLIARVILADAPALYRHLARTPAVERDASALDSLRSHMSTTEVGRELGDAFGRHWRDGKSYLGIASTDVGDAITLLRVADAAFCVVDSGPLPLRTRSTRLLGDSKAIERNLARLLAHLRQVGRLDPTLDREAALAVLGLSKFPPPVLIAGPLTISGVGAGGLAYVGLPPEAMGSVGLNGEVRALLTIENLESFHRQVREARTPHDVIVYCGGFPAQGVVHAVRRLVDVAKLECIHHWGDIDAGGVRIGRCLEEMLEIDVVPHLMSENIARAYGRAVDATAALEGIPGCSSFAPLARFLGSADAHWLEQEMLDPVPLSGAVARSATMAT